MSNASGCGSAWLERHLREVEAACSNHVTPMMMHQKSGTLWVPLFVFSYYCFWDVSTVTCITDSLGEINTVTIILSAEDPE